MPFTLFTPNDKNQHIKSLEENIVGLMGSFNESKNATHTELYSILEKLVDACDAYIQAIPQKERSSIKNKEAFEQDYPNAEAIFKAQQEAVKMLHLYKKETAARSRWELIKDFVTSAKIGKGEKMMHGDFWKESRYQGKYVASWLTHAFYPLVSYKEIGGLLYSTTEKERENYLVHFDADKKLSNKDGFLVDTRESDYIYVIKAGKLYLSESNSNIHHSSLLGGQAVVCAGTIRVNEGEIEHIDIRSGHYRPMQPELYNFLKFLVENIKIDVSKINVTYYQEMKSDPDSKEPRIEIKQSDGKTFLNHFENQQQTENSRGKVFMKPSSTAMISTPSSVRPPAEKDDKPVQSSSESNKSTTIYPKNKL